jgi:hypothetical protein
MGLAARTILVATLGAMLFAACPTHPVLCENHGECPERTLCVKDQEGQGLCTARPNPNDLVLGSCKEIFERGFGNNDNFYTVDFDGDGPLSPRQVRCDMTTAGGGWTLVGRSAGSDANQSIGWDKAAGDVRVPETPYSLGVRQVGLSFTEILVGSRGGGDFSWGDAAYIIEVQDDFMNFCNVNSCASKSGPTTIIGDCENPAMLREQGFTQGTNLFFFRSATETGETGLRSNGWDLRFDGCEGGLINGNQGMIYVR